MLILKNKGLGDTIASIAKATGLDKLVGEDCGCPERQEMLNNPDLLILDEASAALDAETEKRIQQSLFSNSNGNKKRITIAIAHRLATIRNSDEIIALVDGVIVERGNHNDLISNDNVYASQWSIQTGEI